MTGDGRRSLMRRAFALFFAVSLAISALVGVVVTTASFFAYERDAEDLLLAQAQACASALEEQPNGEAMTIRLAETPFVETRATLVAADGTVLYDSYANPTSMENHSRRVEVVQARESGQACVMRRSETLGADSLYAAALVRDGVVVRLAETRVSLASFLSRMAVPLLVVMAAAFLLSLLASRLITRAIVKPLHGIDLARPLDNNAYDELQPLLKRVDAQRTQLEKSMDLRREITANVSHEMKTPLQVIGGYAELMEEGLVTQEDVPRFSGIIRRESECMRGLIDDVLMLSRLEEDGIDTERVPLAGACLRVVERLRPAAEGKGVSLLADLSDDAVVLGNPAIAEQMVYNLVDNAIKHSPEDGTVSVRIASSENAVTLFVTDEGPGVPDELKERVFERFFRADPSRSRETGGTGLGLAIVKHAAESMGGNVRVEDVPGGGAVFMVSLPVIK